MSEDYRLQFRQVDVRCDHRADGTILLRTALPFECSTTLIHEYLAKAAESSPDKVFLAERRRDRPGWETVTYAVAQDSARRIAGFLLRSLGQPARPILMLSGNSIAHQLLALGAMMVGIPYTPISVAYSTLSGDFSRLKHVLHILDPGLVFAEDAHLFTRALSLPEMEGRMIVVGDNGDVPAAAIRFSELSAASLIEDPPPLTPDTVAKILFTSGSTGTPKGVPTTHRMMCGSLDQIALLWPFLTRESPVILDWLPWSHVFGGSFAVNTILRYAGTLYIDDGKPTPADIGKTVRNLRDVSPTLYWNVPKGYELLMPALRSDKTVGRSFFDRLSLMFYAGASLSPRLWEELVSLGQEITGRSIPMTTSWGLTETAPSITMVNNDRLGHGNIGVPMPGLELKMVPTQGKYEARVRGPTVMTGYFRAPEATSAAFDEEGFFKTGDAIRLAMEDDASQGVLFDGRVAEDFKLTSGTWVDAAAIRLRALQALAGHAMDVVVTGEDRHDIGLLIVPIPGATPEAAYRERVTRALSGINRGASGTSHCIARALVLRDPPAFDAGEITEKGSLNARLIRQRRRELIERLHEDADDEIIRPI
jgi:feruloyl-CoA synthase